MISQTARWYTGTFNDVESGPGFDAPVAFPARVHGYWLVRKGHLPTDRRGAEKAIGVLPGVVAPAGANPAFPVRVVRFMSCSNLAASDDGRNLTADEQDMLHWNLVFACLPGSGRRSSVETGTEGSADPANLQGREPADVPVSTYLPALADSMALAAIGQSR